MRFSRPFIPSTALRWLIGVSLVLIVGIVPAAPSEQKSALTLLQDDLQLIPAGSVFRDCPDCPEMVVIPKGNFTMGYSDKRVISIPRAFAVGKFEVTFEQWDACVAAGGCMHNPSDAGWGRETRPVINVNWFDAKEYTKWLSRRTGKIYRLPSEAEWEYAARADTTTAYYWGESTAEICQYANVNTGGFFSNPWGGGCGTDRTSPVGERRPNAFGLYDMIGNVHEWIKDCWSYDIKNIPIDGTARITGDCGRRGLRGGSWGVNAQGSTASYRGRGIAADSRNRYSGFRVVRTD